MKKNHNKKLSGKLSLFMFSITVILFLVMILGSVSAIHESQVSVVPNITASGLDDQPFTATVIAGEGHTIHEFRVYESADFTDLECDSKSGWFGPYYGTNEFGNYCQWNAESGSQIQPNNTDIFTFTMDSPDTECCRVMRTEPRDLEENWAPVFINICVDKTKPETTKEFIGPFKEENGVEWIDGVTKINLTATDCPGEEGCSIENGPHDAGINKTLWKNEIISEEYCYNPDTCDNAVDYTYNDEDWNLFNGTLLEKEDESCHVLAYWSEDGVGNKENINYNCFFVDKTPPEKEREIGDPHYGGCPVDENPMECSGWNECDIVEDKKDFFVNGRYGNNLDEEGDWELSIKSANPETVEVQDGYVWTNGQEVDFSLSYDPSDGSVEYIVDGKTLNWNYDSGKAFGYIVPLAKGTSGNNYAELTDMEINGKSLPDVNSGTGLEGVKVPLGDNEQTNGFTITGKAKLVWDGGQSDERPGFHIFAMDTHNSEDCWVRDPSNQDGTPITLTCTDQQPHPSEDEEVCYQISVDNGDSTDDYCEGDITTITDNGYSGDWCCVSSPKEIIFQEDTFHELEYFCRDAVNKKSEISLDSFRVDSLPPIIEKDMFGNYTGDCPSGTDLEHGDCYVADDGTSGVNISVYDDSTYPDCTVGEVTCDYEVLWEYEPEEWEQVDSGSFSEEGKDIIFTEDSTHKLIIDCEDALGNSVHHEEEFLVDSTPPITTKDYGPEGTYFMDETTGVRYIDTVTEISLDAEDEKVGTENTYYKITGPVEDRFCETDCGQVQPSAHEEGFSEYTGPFNGMNESCHIIEYYSVDSLGNTEDVNWQCVFVDKTPPMIEKTYNGVKYPENLAETEYPHYINSSTLIEINANDSEPHPSGLAEVEYRVSLIDGNDACMSESACMSATGTGDFMNYNNPFTINEDSCHLIEIKARDNVNKTSMHKQCVFVDNQAPKITKEVIGPQTYCENSFEDNGMEFEIENCEGWNCLGEGKKDFMTTGRSDGNNWDMAIGIPDVETLIADQEEELPWTNGAEPVPFEISYEPDTGMITYEVNEKTLTATYDSNKAFEFLVIMAKGNEGGDMNLTDVKVNGEVIGDIISEGNYEGRRIWLPDNWQTEGFSVSGNAAMMWETKTSQEIPGFHVFAMNTHDLEERDCYQVDSVTKINIDATDQMPHPVGEVKCDWWYEWNTQLDHRALYHAEWNGTAWERIEGKAEDIAIPFNFSFPEESEHMLYVECYDALGNKVQDVEKFIVDKTGPAINKEYEGPKYFIQTDNGARKWITSDTNITVNVDDLNGTHDSGVVETKYRYERVNDEYCNPQNEEFVCEDAVFSENAFEGIFDDPTNGVFQIPEDSCHVIEITSIDGVEKTSTHRQCVYVDNQAPTPNKTVGEPKEPWDGLDANFYDLDEFCTEEGNCWKVTTMTPITLDCNDPQPHPVDNEEIYFKVELDGDDYTEQYCEKIDGIYDNNEDGYCYMNKGRAPVEFFFLEESEHNLKYYCVDALGNKGSVDDEKFKVEGEAFKIQINKKWNLISVPFRLLDDNMDKVFENSQEEVETLWQFNGTDWHVYTPDGNPANDDITTMEPGWGYWILAKNDTELVIGGDLISPAMTPPSREIIPGWNLVGYYGTEGSGCSDGVCTEYNGPAGNGKEAGCMFYSLGESHLDKGWSSLIGYWELDNPEQWRYYNYGDNLDPGAGYWLFATENEEGIYAPSTNCNSII